MGLFLQESIFTNIEHNSFTRLPEQIIEVDNLITQSCSGNNNSNGVFAYTGRGGLPPNPLTEYQSGDTVIADFDIPSNSIIDYKFEVSNKFSSNRLNPPPQKIVEAEGWQINENGKIELVALASDNPIPWGFDFSSCPL